MKKILISFFLIFTINNITFANDDIDPFEDVNRTVHDFNNVLYDNVLDPIALVYKDYMPLALQHNTNNFFNNIDDFNTLSNQILQLNLIDSGATLLRIVINSTVGVFGLFDVASSIKLNKTTEDFGQTLAVWGINNGPYIVLPILGPSTIRDSAGIYVQSKFKSNVINNLDSYEFVSTSALNTLNRISKLSNVIDLLEQSYDPYIATRSAYLQRREYNIANGNIIEDDDF